MQLYLVLADRRQPAERDSDEEKDMKNFSEYLVAAALAVGVLTLAAIDTQAATVCGPNGCHRYYPHRSQWPVGQPGKYYNPTPYGCAVVAGQGTCR